MDDTGNILSFPRPGGNQRDPGPVSFHRQELGAILSIYGQLVAAGVWRDYAIDMQRDVATFSIYRRMGERPDVMIEKRPKDAAKQGMYTILGGDGQVLKRGKDLRTALKIFNRKLLKIADD